MSASSKEANHDGDGGQEMSIALLLQEGEEEEIVTDSVLRFKCFCGLNKRLNEIRMSTQTPSLVYTCDLCTAVFGFRFKATDEVSAQTLGEKKNWIRVEKSFNCDCPRKHLIRISAENVCFKLTCYEEVKVRQQQGESVQVNSPPHIRRVISDVYFSCLCKRVHTLQVSTGGCNILYTCLECKGKYEFDFPLVSINDVQVDGSQSHISFVQINEAEVDLRESAGFRCLCNTLYKVKNSTRSPAFRLHCCLCSGNYDFKITNSTPIIQPVVGPEFVSVKIFWCPCKNDNHVKLWTSNISLILHCKDCKRTQIFDQLEREEGQQRVEHARVPAELYVGLVDYSHDVLFPCNCQAHHVRLTSPRVNLTFECNRCHGISIMDLSIPK